MPPPSTATSTAVTLERIECKIDALNNEFLVTKATLTALVNSQQEKVIDHETRLRALEYAIRPIILMNKILGVIGGVFITTLIAFLWSIIIGQIQIVMP